MPSDQMVAPLPSVKVSFHPLLCLIVTRPLLSSGPPVYSIDRKKGKHSGGTMAVDNGASEGFTFLFRMEHSTQ